MNGSCLFLAVREIYGDFAESLPSKSEPVSAVVADDVENRARSSSNFASLSCLIVLDDDAPDAREIAAVLCVAILILPIRQSHSRLGHPERGSNQATRNEHEG